MSMHPISKRKSLAKQLTLHVLLSTICILICASTAIIGLSDLNREFDLADNTHQELRYIFETGYELSRLRELQQSPPKPDYHLKMLTSFERSLKVAEKLEANPEYLRQEEVKRLVSGIKSLKTTWQSGQSTSALNTIINERLGEIASLSQRIGRRLELTRRSARRRYLQTIWTVALTALLTILLSLSLSLIHRKSLQAPLRKLTNAAEAYQGNTPSRSSTFIDLDEWQHNRYAEFDQLANQLNHMASELAGLYQTLENKVQTQSRQLFTQEKLASVGQLAAGVAHEINNPLAIIANYGQSLARDFKASQLDKGRAEEAIHIIVEEAFRCKRLTDKLLSLARQQQQGPGQCDLVSALKHIQQLALGLPDAKSRDIQFLDELQVASCDISIHEADLTQVLLNLISNAIVSTGESGRDKISITAKRLGDHVQISVHDQGNGMDEATLQQIFEPFYTNRSNGKGLGLGLAITHAIIEKNGGTIEVDSNRNQGTIFTLQLKIHDDKSLTK